jgi:hypothetical protein
MNNYPKNWPEGVELTQRYTGSYDMVAVNSLVGVNDEGTVLSVHDPALYPMFIMTLIAGTTVVNSIVTDGEYAWIYECLNVRREFIRSFRFHNAIPTKYEVKAAIESQISGKSGIIRV